MKATAKKFFKELPILFKPEMVRAILENRKTQTRRILKIQPAKGWTPDLYCTGVPHLGWSNYRRRGDGVWEQDGTRYYCPYGKPGDRLWVKETFSFPRSFDDRKPTQILPDPGIEYLAGGTTVNAEHLCDRGKWRPSIFMPRWASRIILEVKDVRVQQLHEITDADAYAEGVQVPVTPRGKALLCVSQKRPVPGVGAVPEFAALWESINGKRGFGWDINPWLWRIEFEIAHIKR